MTGNAFTVFATVVNLIVLYLILRHFFFDKVNNNIESRVNGVKDTIDKANIDRAEAEALRLENVKKLEESKVEGKRIVEEYKGKAEKVSDDVKQEASNEAKLIIERGKTEVERQREKAEDELKKKVVDLAVILSSKALEKSIDDAEHRRLIEEFIAKVGN
jgi:F-type H+-transporting ATPase subunit b